MTAREVIGIGVDRLHVRVVGLQDSDVAWTLDAARDRDEVSLGQTILSLLSRAPHAGNAARKVVVALGPSVAQVRRLDGLPAVEDHATLSQLLQEGVRRWFLMRPGGLVTAGPSLLPDGSTWGAAFDRSTVEEIRNAVESVGLELDLVLPAVVTLGEVFMGSNVRWEDGGHSLTVLLESGRFAGVGRAPADALPSETPTFRPSLGALGGDATRFADAVGAAFIGARGAGAPLALALAPDASREIPRKRSQRARMAVTLAAAAVLLAYPVALWRTSVRLSASLAAVSDEESEGARLLRELARTTEALDAIALRRTNRMSWVTQLSGLASALPPGTAAATLRADSVSGVVVILGPRAGAVVDRLDGTPGFLAPTLIGPVTSENAAGQLLERATISFHLSRGRVTARGIAP